MRDFRRELEDVDCWDETTDRIYRETGVPLQDRVLQNREELIRLCEWIERHEIRSYLEIGVWTGRLVNLLQCLFRFERVAACDPLHAAELGLPVRLDPAVRLFSGRSQSIEYRLWREDQPPFDLVMIDGDHSYPAVAQDFRIHRGLGDRFLAFHDVCGGWKATEGVRDFWSELDVGFSLEIIEPHRESGLSRSRMGIGLWSEQQDPAHKEGDHER